MRKILFMLALVAGLGIAAGCNNASSTGPAVDATKKAAKDKEDAIKKEADAKIEAAKKEKEGKVDEIKKEGENKVEKTMADVAAAKKQVDDATTDLGKVEEKIKTLPAEAKKTAEAALATLKKAIEEAKTAAGTETFNTALEGAKKKMAELKKQVGL